MTPKHLLGSHQATRNYFFDVIAAIHEVREEEVLRAIEILSSAKHTAKSVWIVGNGGSAATAGHFANDLVKVAGIRAFAVPDAGPTVLAYGNDNGWTRMFSDYLRQIMRPGDILVAISCSGKSDNVINAAVENRGNVIVLTGNPGVDNELDNLNIAQVVIYARAKDIRVQEDVHMAVCHAIVGALQ